MTRKPWISRGAFRWCKNAPCATSVLTVVRQKIALNAQAESAGRRCFGEAESTLFLGYSHAQL